MKDKKTNCKGCLFFLAVMNCKKKCIGNTKYSRF